MGSALLRGVLDKKLVSEIMVVEPSAVYDDLKSRKDIIWKNSANDLDATFVPDVVLIAVKPQLIADVLPAYGRYPAAVFLSIAAGMTIARLSDILKNFSAAIVRTMPNLPASIGQGMTVAVANTHVSQHQRDLCDQLLSAVGKCAWVEDEALLDVVTALSGSGPAYVFALCEVMAKVGETMGLSSEMAQLLARQTLVGSGALLAQSTQSAEDLRRAVTSPKGTTEAALRQLMNEQHGLQDLIQKTMTAAAKRAKELAQ